MNLFCWGQDWRKDWSLCNSSGSSSSASGKRAHKMEEPQLLTETHCYSWPEAKLDWEQARMHQPLYFIWSSISAPWPHFALLGLLACSFYYNSPCILRDAANSPSDHHLHELSGLPRPLFFFPMSAIYNLSQQHFSRRWIHEREANSNTQVCEVTETTLTGDNSIELERVRARVNSEVLESPGPLLQSVTHTTNMWNVFA